MMQPNEVDKKTMELPDNAYSELQAGEEYKPVLPEDKPVKEITTWSVGMGLLMAVIFSAAAAYSGLKIGQVFEAAIPISIIAVGASAAFRRKNALGQNVIIQSIGASSGVIVAGAIFTIPGLYILQARYPEIEINFWQIFFSSLLGGFLGILFLIPFRKYFVKDMHGKLPFPEATATTEILMTGEKGGNQAKLLVASGLIGGLFDFCFSAFRLWSEEITTRIIPAGAVLADKFKMVLKFNVSALIFSFGYLVGLRFAVIITVGSLLSWLVLIPLVNEIGALATANGGVNPFAALSAEEIFATYVRPIGIGAIAMAGIIGIIKSSGVIGSAFKLAVSKKGVAGGIKEKGKRTQRDLAMSFVMLFLFLTLIAVFIFLLFGVKITLVQAIVALLTVTIISFLFTTVAANAIAIVGSNPVSGMTLMTLILSSVILVAVGLEGWQGMVSGLIIGGIVCTALSMAGGFVTDLKIGYWIGTTPAKQESWKFLASSPPPSTPTRWWPRRPTPWQPSSNRSWPVAVSAGCSSASAPSSPSWSTGSASHRSPSPSACLSRCRSTPRWWWGDCSTTGSTRAARTRLSITPVTSAPSSSPPASSPGRRSSAYWAPSSSSSPATVKYST